MELDYPPVGEKTRRTPLQLVAHFQKSNVGPDRFRNGDFEENDLGAWEVEGDGSAKIIDRPPDGKGAVDTGQALQMTTGSPIKISQDVYMPATDALLSFEFRFLDDRGILYVLLDGQIRFVTSFVESSPDVYATYEAEIPFDSIFGDVNRNVSVSFEYEAHTGSRVILDNLSIRPVPEATTLGLLALGGRMLIRRRPR